jgi:hypothetical protein
MNRVWWKSKFLDPVFWEADLKLPTITSNEHFFTDVNFVEFADTFLKCVKIPRLITDITGNPEYTIRDNIISYLFPTMQLILNGLL